MSRIPNGGAIAIIPARGASARIPRKNVLPLGGLPVIAHSVLHAKGSRLISEVVVSTDDAEISRIAERHGASVITRPAEISGDTDSSESALLHALDARTAAGLPDPEYVVFLQCTSPLRRAGDIDAAITTLIERGADSLFSAVVDHGLLWAENDEGSVRALNYNPADRKREQDMGRQLRENGSIYVFRTEILRKTGNRLGGKIALFEMDFLSSFQLDAPQHYELLQYLITLAQFAPAAVWPEAVELVVFDFDGVMTDNSVAVNTEGVEQVVCNRSDGWGVGTLRRAGIPAMVVSTEANKVVAARCAKLGLECHHGIGDKGAFLSTLLSTRGINPKNVIFVGNDVNDLGCFEIAGMAVAVADAHPDVKPHADFTLSSKGGDGAVREICDLIVRRYGR